MSTSRDVVYRGLKDNASSSGALLSGHSNSTGGARPETDLHMLDALETLPLSRPIPVIVEPDDGQFLARTPDLPLFGHGDDSWEAIDNLAAEIESLWNDFQSGDDFTADWEQVRELLEELIDI